MCRYSNNSLNIRKVHDLYTKNTNLTCMYVSVHLYTNVISLSPVTPDFAQKAQVYLLAPSISDMRANHVSVTCLLLGHRLNDFSIVWKIGKNNTSQGVTTQPLRVHSNGTESVRSVLKVPAAKWNAYKTVSCEVTHLCGTKKMEHTISKTRGKFSHKHRSLRPIFILLYKIINK